MNRIIEKTDRGLMDILEILGKLRNKNEAFFAGTFQWLIKTHPPFPGSHIVYHVETNEFKHWKIEINEGPFTFENLHPGQYLREKSFIYATSYPYHVIIGKSDWINELLNRKASDLEIAKMINKWIEGYFKQIDEERVIFKNLISFYQPSQSLPLF